MRDLYRRNDLFSSSFIGHWPIRLGFYAELAFVLNGAVEAGAEEGALEGHAILHRTGEDNPIELVINRPLIFVLRQPV